MKSLVTTILFGFCLAVSHADELPDQTSDEQSLSSTSEGTQSEQGSTDGGQNTQGRTIYIRSGRAIANSPEDVASLLQSNEQRQKQRDSLIPVTPLGPVRDQLDRVKESIYEAASLRLGITWNNLYQVISDGFPGTDRWGVVSDFSFFGTWELIKKGTPTQGQIFFQIEGRWDYGTTGPTTLGITSLGSWIHTANTFAAYTPTFLPFRNVYWQQGSAQARWLYRIGKITPDQILGTSFHLNPFTTFHPTGSVAANQPFADSGLGVAGAWYFNDRSYVLGVFSDANADRQDFGDIGAGDFYKALEFGYKINPKTQRAGYSKLTVGHTDGTSDGSPINASLGPSGWGISLKLEQELTADGRAIGILKYGTTTNDSGLYKHLASAHFLLYDPPTPTFGRVVRNDLVGVGFTWAEPNLAGTRDEANLELFYRFPLLPQVDTTLSYQSVFNPALNPDVNHASVFSLRLRTTF